MACEARRQPVLIIDEAHHLENDVLEDLRLLTNFAMDSAERLCLVLVTGPCRDVLSECRLRAARLWLIFIPNKE